MATFVPRSEAMAKSTEPGGFLKYLPSVALCGVAVLLVTALWLVRTLGSAYWLDETGTYWATNGGLKEIPARCVVFPMSLLYAWLILAVRTLFGSGEAVARIPSVLSIALAVYVMFRNVRVRWGSNAAWIAAAVFVSIPEVTSLAGDARPYALGLLFTVLSTSLLLRFFQRPSYQSAALYALAAALMVHMQLLYGAVLLAHLLYAALQLRRGRLPNIGYVATAVALLAVLMIPVALQLRSMAGHSGSHSFAPMPGAYDLVSAYFPIPVMTAILGAAIAGILLTADSQSAPSRPSDELVLAGLVAFIPPFLCFLASRLTHLGLFLGRYFVGYAAGLAVCSGVLLASVRSGRAARAVMISIALFQLTSLGLLIRNRAQGHTMHRGDWAAAVKFVDQNTAADGAPALVRSQYIESDFNPIEPVNDNPMFSQFAPYPSRSHLAGLRATLNEAEVERTLNGVLSGSGFPGRFLLMSYDSPKPLAPLVTFLAGHLGPAFSLRELGDFDGIHVLEFRKNR